jgi:molybdenum-dependent DNA-binding transcriptional regulator ModE
MKVQTENIKTIKGGNPHVACMLHGTKTVIKHKIGLLNLAEELGNVSKACRIMGLSRDTFYRYQNAAEQGGVEVLIDRGRRKPNLKNRVDEQTEGNRDGVDFLRF